MYLIPLIRTNRAISACILMPDYPIQAIAASEIVSYICPFIKYPPFDLNIIGFSIYLIYEPEYAHEIMQKYKELDIIYYKLECLLLLIFIANYML